MNMFVHHLLDFSDLVDFDLFGYRVTFYLLHNCVRRILHINMGVNLYHILILHYNQKWSWFPPLYWLQLWPMPNSASLTKTVWRLLKKQLLPVFVVLELYTRKKGVKQWIALVSVWAFLWSKMNSCTKEWSQLRPSATLLQVWCLRLLVQR